MPLLTWNHASSVGIRAMDDQHGILMDSMNDLRLAIQHGECCGKIGKTLGQLIRFMQLHFASEEQLLERHGFPDLDAHRCEHRRLLAHLLDAASALERHEKTGLRGLSEFLRQSFPSHLAEFDRSYAAWLNDRGIF